MPIARAIERNSVSLPNSPPKSLTLSCHLSSQHEETQSKKSSDTGKKCKNTNTNTNANVPHSARRPVTQENLPAMRGRSNTDTQACPSLSNNLKQQISLTNSGSDKSLHQNYRSQSPSTPKPISTLPTTTAQQGYVTPSKLFNMMGYGLEQQYLFMLAHYLYIIDCRSKEKFHEKHIATGTFHVMFTSILYFVFSLLSHSLGRCIEWQCLYFSSRTIQWDRSLWWQRHFLQYISWNATGYESIFNAQFEIMFDIERWFRRISNIISISLYSIGYSFDSRSRKIPHNLSVSCSRQSTLSW